MYSCRWFEHAYMHMFSCIEMHMLIYVNTDRIARACLPPSMYTCICSRALWYIYYSCIQTCICSSRVEPYTHSCSHTYGHLCSHTYKHMHMHTHVHACAHMSKCTDVRSCKESDVFWNTMKSSESVYSPNSLSCKGFLRWWEKGFRSKLPGASAFGTFWWPISPTLIYMQICINGEDRWYGTPIKLGEPYDRSLQNLQFLQ